MTFRSVASLLLPTDAGPAGAVIEAGEDWEVDRSSFEGVAAAVWGRAPARSGMPAAQLLRHATARERALRSLLRRPPAGLLVAGVHRWAPAVLRPSMIRAPLRSSALGGLLVELGAAGGGDRVLDAAARAADLPAPVGRFRPGSGGGLSVHGRVGGGDPAVLRVGWPGAGDPARGWASLRALAEARPGPGAASLIPRPIGSGEAAGASWTLEAALAGMRPTRLDRVLLAGAAGFAADLPVVDGPPTAPAEDLRELASVLPTRSDQLERLASATAAGLEGAPSTHRHGDLWTGNLLVARGRLAGVVDWDAWHPRGVPGADLLHLVATERALSARRSLGDEFLRRPWLMPAFRDAVQGLPAVPADPEVVAVAWWACQVAASLRRLPHLSQDDGWLGRNVDPVLRSLAP